MAVRPSDKLLTASATTVVGVGLRAALNGRLYSSQLIEPSYPVTKISALSGVTVLNGQVSVLTNDKLGRQAATANEARNRVEVIRSQPTADTLRHKSTGLKDAAKMVIKVDPRPEEGRENDAVPGLVFDKFSLQSVTESDDERYQLHETFAEEVLFLFGRRPRIWTLAGIVVNSDDANYANELVANYNDYYRGTRVVDMQARTFVFYEDVLVEGVLLGLMVSRNAQIPAAVNASLTIAVIERSFLFQTADDVSDANLARFLEDAQRSLTGVRVEPDQIMALKPGSADLAQAANETSGVETAASAAVAVLEQELAAAEDRFDKANEAYASAQVAADDLSAQAAVARATGDETAASAFDDQARVKTAEARTYEASAQEAQDTIATVAGELVEKKAEMTDAAAKADAQAAAAAAAAGAEGSTSSATVVVDIYGRVREDKSIGELLYLSEIAVTSGGQPAVSVGGGESVQAVFQSVTGADGVAAALQRLYGVVVNQGALLSLGEVTFHSQTQGRLL